jgi:hypothetical protein
MDWIVAQMDRLSILLGLPPWIVAVTVVFIFVLIIGVGMVFRDRAAGSGGLNWNRDPDEMPDLSPRLRQARIQMLVAALAMIGVLVLAIANLLVG